MTRVCLWASRQGSIAIAATLSAWLGMLSVFHAESASGAQSTPNEAVPVESRDVRYVELQPSFITNVGVSDSGHLMYIRADISVRVSSQPAEMATRYHLPALRNALVLLLSRQDEATVSTGGGRELIRAEALAELRTILEIEEGEPCIDDLMFTNFIVQR